MQREQYSGDENLTVGPVRMAWMHNLSFKGKMLLPVVMVMLTMGLVLWSSFERQSEVTAALVRVADVHIPAVDYLLQADRDLYQVQVAERTMLNTDSGSEVFRKLQDEHRSNIAQARARLQKYVALEQSAENAAQVKALFERFEVWQDITNSVLKLRLQDTPLARQQAIELSLGESEERFHQTRNIIDQLGEVQLHKSSTEVTYEQMQTARSQLVLLMLGGVGVVLSTLILLTLGFTVTRRLNTVLLRLNEIADGESDLTKRLQLSGRDELGQIAEAFNHFIGRIHDLVATANHASLTVAMATSEMARGNHDLAVRTESQAAGLQKTAQSIKEITGSVQQNADNAQRASDVALTAKNVAESGGHQVNEVIEAMRGIAASSRRISDIVGAVDNIAFQTNLLALNAAVEAARAGDQGVGFAVVATEVRSLAQRSAASANEIKKLIEESLSKVAEGTALADRSGEALQEILASVDSVAALITGISSESLEQSDGIKRVNLAISEIEGLTQSNATLVEEAAVSMEQLSGQARGLNEILSEFKLQQSDTAYEQLPKGTRRSQQDQFRPAGEAVSGSF